MSGRPKIRFINGANLNFLGQREPEIYGHTTLDEISSVCIAQGAKAGIDVEFMQSNHEGKIVEWIQQAVGSTDAIVLNAGGFTHTSVVIHDALKIYAGYKVELHISNPHLREPFRHISYVSPAVDAVIAGLGVAGYAHVVRLLAKRLAA